MSSISTHTTLADPRVSVKRANQSCYTNLAEMSNLMRELCDSLGWATETSAFGALVGAGDNVLVKPNWVLHRNQGAGGFTPLVTHGAVIRSVVSHLLGSNASQVTLGDAPVQGCDFQQLLEASELGEWLNHVASADARFIGPVDFRRTISAMEDGVRSAVENVRPLERYVLFDVGEDSYLEPVTDESMSFRVTMYPPHLMAQTHSPGRHQYLVAREVLEADLIVNVPKLKTHKKAGVTCALKNLVGINGNKEYLPHHRFGGSEDGGDCYPGSSPVKRMLEQVLDVQNSSEKPGTQRAMSVVARALFSISNRMGDEYGVEGSWSGNDTVWRMCLDLNRIALYGRIDGTIAHVPQRRLVHIVDAIVAGQGDGPLSPEPLEMGLLMAGHSAAAVDWVGALLLGYDPRRIPIAQHAFDANRWPLVNFSPNDVNIIGHEVEALAALVSQVESMKVNYPVGWRDAVRDPSSAFHDGGEPPQDVVRD